MKFEAKKKLISGGGLAVLSVLFITWCVKAQPSIAGFISALISVCLFAIVCLRFVPVWINAWSSETHLSADKPTGETKKIFICLLGWDVLIIILVFIIRSAMGYASTFEQSLEFWASTDSRHYLDIARDWYLTQGDIDRLVQLVFLPGFPIVVRAVNFITDNYLYAGLLVSALCFAFSGCVFYKLLRLDMSRDRALRAVKFLVISPAAFFFTAPMSESLFMLLSISCLYLSRREKYLAAAVLGALAAFTRSVGIILLVPLLFELVQNRAKLKSWFTLLIVLAGFAAYLWINYAVSGDAFKFMEYQSKHWGQHLGFFWNTAAYQTEYAIQTAAENTSDFLGLWLPNLIASFAALIIMIPGAGKLRASYTAWFIAYFAVTIGATWLLSAPRYLLVMITLPMVLSELGENKSTDNLLTVICMAGGLLYITAFCARWQVW